MSSVIKGIELGTVPKLESTNFKEWRIRVTLLLKSAELWEIVTGDSLEPTLAADRSNEAEIKAWKLKDTKAHTLIVTVLGKRQLCHVSSCNSAKETWDKLVHLNSDSSTLNKQTTQRKFFNYKITADQSLVDAFGDMEEIAQALDEMGSPMETSAVVTKIVSALPEEKYQAFKKAWDSVPEADQTMERLLSRLRNEELQNENQKGGASSTDQLVTSAFKFKKDFKRPQGQKPKGPLKQRRGNCNNCKQPGHWARECPDKKEGEFPKKRYENKHNKGKRQNERNDGPPDCQAFMGATNQVISTDWISDSGATDHFTGRKDWITEFQEYSTPVPISLASGEAMALGKGTIEVEALIGDNWTKCTINDVIYVPGASNLFSESVMDKKGYTIIRKDQEVKYFKEDIPGPVGKLSKGLYVMQFREKYGASSASKKDNAMLWHRRLAHINTGYIRNSIKNNAITGINLDEVKSNFDCEACHCGKEKRKPFPVKDTPSNVQPGEIIHGDLSGKVPNSSLGGTNYFLLLKDDATGFRHVTFLKTKSETPTHIIKFIRLIKNQTGRNVKAFRSDNGTEFVNKELTDFFAEEGIIHQLTAPFNPESNGKAEREMRTIKDCSRAMLQFAHAPEFLWAEAVATTVYVHNRIGNYRSMSITPFESIFGKKPDLRHIRTFGCKAYVHIPREQRRMWDSKARLCILVGYDPLSRKYRLYESSTRKILLARNVSFNEDEEQFRPVLFWDSDDETPTPGESTLEVDTENEVEDPQDSEFEECVEQLSPLKNNLENTLVINNGNCKFEIPLETNKHKTKVKLPGPTLRNRDQLKQPDRFQAKTISKPTEPKSFKEAINSLEADKWWDAMEEEITSLEQNETWTLVDAPEFTKVLDPKWVYKIKRNPEGEIERFKARLVIRGFKQEFEVDFFDTFSTVVRYESIRLVLALSATHGWKMMQFDVKTAFLNGVLEEEIFMSQPQGFINDKRKVCKLHKSLYGLRQSPRCWNKRITEFLGTLGLIPTASDPCVYVLRSGTGNIEVILALYVDDGLLTGPNPAKIDEVLSNLQTEFIMEIKDRVEKFVGLEIHLESEALLLTQVQYVKDLLARFNMSTCKPASVPMQPNIELSKNEDCDTKLPYRELVGSLLFLARVSRPDIAYSVSKLAQFSHCFTEEHWEAGKTVLRYLSGTADFGIRYEKHNDFQVYGFSDSDYAGDKCDRKSTTGYAFYVNGGIISWASQKQEIVALSSTEAEYIAVSTASREGVWLRNLATELCETQTGPTNIFVDNTSAIRLVENPEFHKRTKHIDVRFHHIRELTENGIISVEYVPTTQQTADILTKPLAKTKYSEMRKLMGINSLLGLIAMFMILLQSSNCVTIKNSEPVLSRKSGSPVISGYEKVTLRIIPYSPCQLITNETVHVDLVQPILDQCEKMYKSYFVDEVENLCPATLTKNMLHLTGRN